MNDEAKATSVDPVCHMTVVPGQARGGSYEHAGTTYWFCNPKCRTRFAEDPARYLEPEPESAPPPEVAPGEKMEWICPMDPEVLADAPGPCPICGMALEPRVVSAHDEANPELEDMKRRLVVAASLSIPLVAAAMLDMLEGAPVTTTLGLSARGFGFLQLALASPVVLWAGLPFFERGVASIRRRSPNMFTLIAIGTGAAYGFSAFALLFPHVLPHGMAGHGALYFESAAGIITLVLVGQVLELRARGATSAAIKALLRLAPNTARRIGADGAESDVPLEQVVVDDRLRVRPGERVPVDAVVVEGTSSIDESMITGEPIPVEKAPAARVTAGTMNGPGSLVIRAEHVGRDTLLARIVQMVTEAQRSRAPIQRLVDVVSSWFVPTVVAVAIVTAIVWGFFGPEPRVAHALVNAVAVLIIACPCALGLATPMSIMVGTGRGAQMGVLVRNAEAIERLERVDTVVVDKTGTLTEGKPRLVAVETFAGRDEDTVLCLAAALETGSEHPLATAVLEAARTRNVAVPTATSFVSVPGEGLRGRVGAQEVTLGNTRRMIAAGVTVDAAEARAEAHRERGHTVAYVAVDGALVGFLVVADPVKTSTREALRNLAAEGVRVVMLTGDSHATAHAVARELGIGEVFAEIAPEGKRDIVRLLQKEARVVAMAGDGINDAPALAQADVGIAMGTGTDVAMESASVTLVRGDLRGIARAIRLSRATMRNIRQNLVFAFVYNAFGVPIAAGLLYPFFGLLLSPLIAAAAMSASSVSVIGNALRLRRFAV